MSIERVLLIHKFWCFDSRKEMGWKEKGRKRPCYHTIKHEAIFVISTLQASKPSILWPTDIDKLQFIWFKEPTRLLLKINRACNGSSTSSLKSSSHCFTRLWNSLLSAKLFNLMQNTNYARNLIRWLVSIFLAYAIKAVYIQGILSLIATNKNFSPGRNCVGTLRWSIKKLVWMQHKPRKHGST